MPLTFGSLFAGIGGFDLGFERAGMVCKWQVEINEFCRKVLAKHWPDVRRHDDVRTFPPRVVRASYSWRGAPVGPFAPDVYEDCTRDEWGVDVICGGFPCQDISYAGLGAGLDGERSGLFFEFARVVRVLEPRIVVLENVAALLGRGLDAVLGTLAAFGFDAEWAVVPAEAFGAPHERERVFIIAYAKGERCRSWWTRGLAHGAARLSDSPRWHAANTAHQESCAGCESENWGGIANGQTAFDVADANGTRLAQRQGIGRNARQEFTPLERSAGLNVWQSKWPDEPALLGMDDGIPDRVDRTRAIGNAVVPQVAQWIGERIVEAEESLEARH